MRKFILLSVLFIVYSSTVYAQEDKVTQGVVTTTTNTTYTTVTHTKQQRMSDEEWAEYKAQRRQAFRDSLAKRINNSSTNQIGWNNSINIKLSGAKSKIGYGVMSPSIGIEYIGGQRYNNFLFLGFGSGIVFNTEQSTGKWKDTSFGTAKRLGLTTVSIPLYANFRIYLSSRMYQPYISFSTGFRFSGNKSEQVKAYSFMSPSDKKIYNDKSYDIAYGTTQCFLSSGFGVDFSFNSKPKISLQVSFLSITKPWMLIEQNGNILDIDVNHSFNVGYQVHLGFTF